ncbi:uncharacterized protein RJT21DRAFT_121530 [Scheffersomyces amazonensis]|uniref:uncharacterized protein n=1 Tax=Scheffersomyces amazonensis TaxID=1078765 RepID=UPI00315CED95
MSSLKKALKAAKSAIEHNDPLSALESVEEALEYDPDCYFALIFQAKSYQLLDDIPKAIESFQHATTVEPSTLLGWKGYLQAVKSSKDYELFFSVATKLIKLQVDEGVAIADTLKDIRKYLDINEYKKDPVLHVTYLRSIIPGTELGDLIGNNLGRPEDNVKSLLDLEKSRVEKDIKNRISKERVKFGRILTVDQKSILNSIEYTYYEAAKLDSLYELLLNISNDDTTRREYEEQYLKYKYDVLKVIPDKDKSVLLADIKQMVEGMVLIKSSSQLCWDLYFNLSDVASLSDLDFNNVIYYLNHFSNKGLGGILFALTMSDISPFDKEKVIEGLSAKFERETTKHEKTDVDSEEEETLLSIEDDEFETDKSQYNLLPDQVLSLMLEGFEHASHWILANRIIIEYYIHLREYAECSERCREAIKLLADLQRSHGIDLKNSREDILCSLAVVYTYYEAPKNFPRALQLYDKVLEGNKVNVKARIGKGLILVEQRSYEAAHELLQDVVKEYPANTDANVELYWCLIKLGQFTEGRNGLLKVIQTIPGTDIHSRDVRALIHWRIAQSLLSEDDKDPAKVDEAYGHLVESLKESQNYAPAYTLLGTVLQEYYGDRSRAQKCFYKAVELDVVEVSAAKYLVEDLATKNEWSVAEILCKRLVDSDTARRLLLSNNYEDPDRSWPFRMLGCSALNKQDDAKAVEWFQSALRFNSADTESWSGLGEAYFNCGRFDAAVKVFKHAVEIDPTSWVSQHLLGLTHCKMGEFEEGFAILGNVLEARPDEEFVLNALYEAYVEYSQKLVAGGFFGRSSDACLHAIELLSRAFTINKQSQSLWKSLAECTKIYKLVGQNVSQFPMDIVQKMLVQVDFDSFRAIDGVGDDLINLSDVEILYKDQQYEEALAKLVVLYAKAAVVYLPSKSSRYLSSIVYYNLGLSYLEVFHVNNIEHTRDIAISYLKKAIQLEGDNALFWIALGNSYVTSHPQIAQHCFIKATVLDSRNVSIWTNLAALYLYWGDTELAQETFLRSQSVAPSESQSWLGHALTAQASGDETTSSRLFTHAFILSNGRSPLAQFLYGLSVLSSASGSDIRDPSACQELSVANQAMIKYLKYCPDEVRALQIAVNIAERCRNFTSALEMSNRLCDLLANKYDSSESEDVLMQFARAKSQEGRLYMGLQQYNEAINSAQFALELVGNESPDISDLVVSCRITIGLSKFFQHEFGAALDQLRLILQEHHESQQLVTLVAQILYANGTDESKQAAIDQLFAFIESNGSSLLVVLTLGAISVVDDLEEYLAPIKEELESLSLAEYHWTIPTLLEEINKRLDTHDTVWQRSALLFPGEFEVWRHINTDMSLAIASFGGVSTTQLSLAYLDSGKLREVQRSMLLCPGTVSS